MPHQTKFKSARAFLKQMSDGQRLGTVPEKLKKMRQFLRIKCVTECTTVSEEALYMQKIIEKIFAHF